MYFLESLNLKLKLIDYLLEKNSFIWKVSDSLLNEKIYTDFICIKTCIYNDWMTNLRIPLIWFIMLMVLLSPKVKKSSEKSPKLIWFQLPSFYCFDVVIWSKTTTVFVGEPKTVCRITLATLDKLTYNEFALTGNINIQINQNHLGFPEHKIKTH